MTDAALTGAQQAPAKIPVAEIYNVRSYMFDDIETRESLWLDRVGNPWAEDIAKVLENLAIGVPTPATVSISDDYVALKLTKNWKVGIGRDGAVVIKVSDCALIADSKFLLLCMDKDGYYTPVAKSEEITWDGTEEYYVPSDIRRLVKDVLRRVLERAQWL
jgi:hypothetical protein